MRSLLTVSVYLLDSVLTILSHSVGLTGSVSVIVVVNALVNVMVAAVGVASAACQLAQQALLNKIGGLIHQWNKRTVLLLYCQPLVFVQRWLVDVFQQLRQPLLLGSYCTCTRKDVLCLTVHCVCCCFCPNTDRPSLQRIKEKRPSRMSQQQQQQQIGSIMVPEKHHPPGQYDSN